MFKDKLNFISKSQQRKTLGQKGQRSSDHSVHCEWTFRLMAALDCADDLIKLTGKEKTRASISFQ